MTGRDRGSGSVLVLAVVATAVLLAAGAAGVAATAVAASRAAGAADASALAGAAAATTGQDPCAAASTAARSAGSELVGCAVGGGGVVDVEVSVAPRGALAGLVGDATARARAGPAA